jgi:anti-sigma factor ChrR (cupin superfamily)
MADWLGFNIDKAWLEENIRWKDFGTGVRLGRLYREDACSLVLYEADSEVTVDAFMPHSHPGGEAYIVLEGEVWDEDGTYPAGSLVWMNRETTHTPKTRG